MGEKRDKRRNIFQALPIGDESVGSEVTMWRAVIDVALSDALYTGRSKELQAARERAISWFDKANIDFQMVCDMADLDRDLVLKIYYKAKVDPNWLRSIIQEISTPQTSAGTTVTGFTTD